MRPENPVLHTQVEDMTSHTPLPLQVVVEQKGQLAQVCDAAGATRPTLAHTLFATTDTPDVAEIKVRLWKQGKHANNIYGVEGGY